MRGAWLLIRAVGLAQTEYCETHYPVFGTVTYRDGEQWEPRQITRLMRLYRDTVYRHSRGTKMPYVWVIEPTKRGRPHYHYIVWIPDGLKVPKPDLAGWWTHGSSRVERARNPAGYLAKYLWKPWPVPLDIPGRVRRYAIHVQNKWISRHRLPDWLQYYSKLGERWRRVPKHGGWICMDDGRYFSSPWIFHNGQLTWRGWEAEWTSKGRFNFELWCSL
ncbi:MAG: hypothetical protein HYY48_09830 [Gammaproteobacteria bacterium]|nr:hypothetical protein [Gammaproteobacteria bacterium]